MGSHTAPHRSADTRTMRALAHPTRLRVLAELRVNGPRTVGLLSQMLDEPVGNVSFHLGKLAAQDLVVEVPELARDRRERWWRAAQPSTLLGDDAADHEHSAASRSLRRAVAQRHHELLTAYLDQEAALDEEWRRNATSSDTILNLTAAQLAELSRDINELNARWERRSSRDDPDAVPVVLIQHAIRRPG